jgi:hypothetical protein
MAGTDRKGAMMTMTEGYSYPERGWGLMETIDEQRSVNRAYDPLLDGEEEIITNKQPGQTQRFMRRILALAPKVLAYSMVLCTFAFVVDLYLRVAPVVRQLNTALQLTPTRNLTQLIKDVSNIVHHACEQWPEACIS